MTSEAHKRNPPGSERWGKINKLRLVTVNDLEEILAADMGAPALYVYGELKLVDSDEWARWQAARSHNQALPVQGE